MFESRVATFVAHLSESSISDANRELVLEQLSLFEEVERFLVRHDDASAYGGKFSQLGESVLNDLRAALSSGAEERLLNWVRDAADSLLQYFDFTETEVPINLAEVAFLQSRLRSLSNQATVLQDQATLRAATLELNAELENSAARAKNAAGIIGTASLAIHFGGYADREARSADIFRVSALIGFVGALAFALIFGNGANGFLLTFENEWTALVFKAAGTIGISGIGAYLARQSAQHRRMANWARSMEVQLQSFPAFIEPLAYEQQAEMYTLLARRVLTAPPEKSSSAADDSVGTAQLLDVMTSVVKRSSASGA